MLIEKGMRLLLSVLFILMCVPTQADIMVPVWPDTPFFPKDIPHGRSSIEMHDASVDISVGTPTCEKDISLAITVNATFLMRNKSYKDAALHVSYPCTQYGEMVGFEVVSSNDQKKVKIIQKEGQYYSWDENFLRNEERMIKVKYGLNVSRKSQKALEKLHAKADFIRTLDPKTDYFFFDYSLTSGATWKGTIGKETVRLHFGDTWAPQTVFCNQAVRLKQENLKTWVYLLENEEPTKDLYFALPANTLK